MAGSHRKPCIRVAADKNSQSEFERLQVIWGRMLKTYPLVSDFGRHGERLRSQAGYGWSVWWRVIDAAENEQP